MKTYNTYQEAKIANPSREIYYSNFANKSVYGTFESINKFTDVIHKCSPSDYYMTLGEFFAKGYKFVDGDLFINHIGELKTVGKIKKDNYYDTDIANEPDDYDYNYNSFVLRAKALEQVETPEEKETFDAIDRAKSKA